VTASLWDFAADILDPTDESGIWIPYPKQQIATELAGEADETLFGGAAGPGKTEWGMEYVIDQMELFPNNRGAIFRRVFPSLQKSVIPRIKTKLCGRAAWNGQNHEFTFPNGSILELASLQYEDSVLAHQGAEYGVIFFEEITEFMLSQWVYMLGRLRAPAAAGPGPDGQKMRPHAIATTNPGGRGHTWVKRRFVKPKPDDLAEGADLPAPMTVWKPEPSDDDPEPNTRAFIPATHADNPKLLERDPGYLRRLKQNPDRGLRLAMLHGDWDAIEAIVGALWVQTDLEVGRVQPIRFHQKVKTHLRVVAVDPSDGEEDGDEFGVSVCSRGMDGVGYVEQSHAWKASTKRMAEQTMSLYHEVGADALVIERNHGGKWMLEVFRHEDPYANIVDVWASDGKRTRARPVAHLFEYDPQNRDLPFKARMVGTHEELEEELTTTTFGPGDPSPNRLDAMVWALSWLMLGQRVAESQGGYQDGRLSGRR
jgi:hypothetical protein